MLEFEFAPRSVYADRQIPDRLLDEIADVQACPVSSSTQIGYLLLNRHLIGEESPIVSIGGFMSDITTPDRSWEGINLATLNRPVLMLDMPGHGISSPHNKQQIIDLCFKRSTDSQAEPLTETVQRIFNPKDEIDYFGISHGAYLSLKATEQDPADRVGTIFGIDLPAVKKQKTLGLQFNYVFKDNFLGRKNYIEELRDSDLWDDYKEFEKLYEKLHLKPASSFIRNNPDLFLLNLVSSVNASSGALETWQNVLDETSANVRVRTAEYSSVSDFRAIKGFIEKLPEKQKARSSQSIGGEKITI